MICFVCFERLYKELFLSLLAKYNGVEKNPSVSLKKGHPAHCFHRPVSICPGGAALEGRTFLGNQEMFLLINQQQMSHRKETCWCQSRKKSFPKLGSSQNA